MQVQRGVRVAGLAEDGADSSTEEHSFGDEKVVAFDLLGGELGEVVGAVDPGLAEQRRDGVVDGA